VKFPIRIGPVDKTDPQGPLAHAPNDDNPDQESQSPKGE
jgi:hypothetical protein